jgi:hypothetical protein
VTAINDSWTFDGVALNSGLTYNIRILSPNEAVPGRRGENLVVPNRDGRIYRAKAMDQRIVSLAMFAAGNSGTALESTLKTLKQLFGIPGERNLVRVMASGGTRTICAEVANIVEFQPISHLAYNAVVEFVCADPYWTGAAYTVTQNNFASSGVSMTVVNNGSAVNERATITVHDAITNPRLTCGTFWVQYTGVVATGKNLVINCDTFTATYDGVDCTALITHSGGVRWMRFLPGNNTLTLTGSGLTTPDVTVAFTELWL